MKRKLIIIGVGLAGLSAAFTAAEAGFPCILVSQQPSERSQSVLAEGGINGEQSGGQTALQSHWQDTMKAGSGLSDPNAVRNLVRGASEIICGLMDLGTPFQMTEEGPALRKLGGHTRPRTVYAGNSTGKAILTALADAVRRQEAAGLVTRMDNHRFRKLILQEERCLGCFVQDCYTGATLRLYGPVLLASGGMSGLLPGHATGTVKNDGSVTAAVFRQGVELGNLEFIQYHPTTVPIPGKNLLVSEAARSAGGRLFTEKNGAPWYFLEDLYGPEGNLVSRDRAVTAMWKASFQTGSRLPVYLDMRGIPAELWKEQLAQLKEECEGFLHIDPEKNPVPVEPAVHYFMGGILVDEYHRTNKRFLYAAGECACQYHGASRLGGNSLLGALYGGKTAALAAMEDWETCRTDARYGEAMKTFPEMEDSPETGRIQGISYDRVQSRIGEILWNCLGIVRTKEDLEKGGKELEKMMEENDLTQEEKDKIRLGIAMVRSALERRESRGAHQRLDAPETCREFCKTTVAAFDGRQVTVRFRDIPADREAKRE